MRANRQRKATRRQQETTQAREARCVCQQQACTLLHTCVACVCFFWLGCCPLLYVRTSYVSRDPVSCIVSAYLVSYCLPVQQQRFHYPTLKPTPTCPSAASGVRCCVHVSRVFFFIGMFPFIVRAYLVCVAHKNENIKHEKK